MILDVDPKVDYAFKRVFGMEKNRDILIHLLNAVLARSLGRPLVSIDILNPFSSKDSFDDKLSILDIKARDESGRLFNVEMQLLSNPELRKRLLYYWAGLHSVQLSEGQEYGLLRPTISICILDRIIFPQPAEYHLVFELANRASGIVFSEDLQIHTIELPKFTLLPEQLGDPLDAWCYFLRHAGTFDTDRLPETMLAPPFRRAVEELEMLTRDDLERERYKSRLRKMRDDAAFASDWRAEGRTEGVLIGRIQTLQELLQRDVSTLAELETKSLDELQKLADQLRDELTRPK